MSDRRKAERAAYDALVADLLVPPARCVPCWQLYGRSHPPEDPHHRRQMGDGGAWSNPANILPVCREAHDWIHAHSARGGVPHQRGWLVMEGDDEYEGLGARAWRLQ